MARPRTFSLDDATHAAMQVFWRHGYEEAGLTELLDAMGIVRGSFYKAFGSKQALFLRVLDAYDAMAVEPGVALLTDENLPGRERIALFFAAGLDAVRTGEGRGCLLCNAASGPVLEDEDVREAVRAQMDRLRNALAVAAGDEAEGARLLVRYVGLQVLGRGGMDDAVLEATIADLASDLASGATTLQ